MARLAWLPIPLLLVTILVLWAADLDASHDSPYLVIVLNFIFSVLASLFSAYLIGRSFLVTRAPGLLLLGCGMVIWGLAGIVATIAGLAGAPPVVIHNTCVWISAGCHLAGVIVSLGSTRKLRAGRLWLAGGYAAALGTVALVALLALAGWLPTFFVQGHGGTMVREVVLGSAVAMFGFTAILLWTESRGAVSAFTQWYVRALALIAVGLFGVMVQAATGTLLGWTGRAAQFLSGAYMLVAAFESRREPRAPGIPLAQAMTEARYRYPAAIALTVAAAVVRLTFLSPIGSQVPFATFYPAVLLAALYGGVGPGLLAGALSAFLVDFFWIEPLSQFTIGTLGDWVAMTTFLLSVLMISLITEAMHRAQTRAREAQTRAEVAAAREQDLEALRDANARIDVILERMSDGFVTFDLDWRYTHVNPAAARAFGMTPEQLLGQTLWKMWPAAYKLPIGVAFRRAIQDNVPVQFEIFYPEPLNRWFECRCFPTPEGLATFFTDISERKDSEEALRASEKALRQANESLEQNVQQRTADLARTIKALEAEVEQRQNAEQALQEANRQLISRAGQLRALAGGITLAEQRERRRMASVLHDHLQQLLVGAKFRVAIVGRMGDDLVRQAAREVEELLDECIGSSRSLTAELSPPILHEGGLIAGLEWLARWMADKHGMFVELEAQPDASPAAEDVKALLFQSVRELLFNAVKHSGAKSVSVSLRRLKDDLVHLVVSDTGRGFDPKALKLGGISGGGFGLFSIRERLELIGGHLEIDSALGKGSRFAITAPMGKPALPEPHALSAEAQMLNGRTVHVPSSIEGAKIRVMLADDHVVMRQGLALLLGAEPDVEIVGEAGDGIAAVELAGTLHPDVILMDLSMPGLNGVDATQAIHNKFPDIRIIGLSMFEESERAQAMLDAGAVNYLIKSGPAVELVAAIRTSSKLNPGNRSS